MATAIFALEPAAGLADDLFGKPAPAFPDHDLD